MIDAAPRFFLHVSLFTEDASRHSAGVPLYVHPRFFLHPALALLLGALGLFHAQPTRAQTTIGSDESTAKSALDGTGLAECLSNVTGALCVTQLTDYDFKACGNPRLRS